MQLLPLDTALYERHHHLIQSLASTLAPLNVEQRHVALWALHWFLSSVPDDAVGVRAAGIDVVMGFVQGLCSQSRIIVAGPPVDREAKRLTEFLVDTKGTFSFEHAEDLRALHGIDGLGEMGAAFATEHLCRVSRFYIQAAKGPNRLGTLTPRSAADWRETLRGTAEGTTVLTGTGLAEGCPVGAMDASGWEPVDAVLGLTWLVSAFMPTDAVVLLPEGPLGTLCLLDVAFVPGVRPTIVVRSKYVSQGEPQVYSVERWAP